MKLDAFILIQQSVLHLVVGQEVWTDEIIDSPADLSAEEVAFRVVHLIQSGNAKLKRVGIGLPSRMFFPVELAENEAELDGDELKFLLEESLPVEAEAMSIRVDESASRALVLNHEWILEFLEVLGKEQPATVSAVVSTSEVLAAAIEGIDEPCGQVIVSNGCSLDSFWMKDGVWDQWQYMPGARDGTNEAAIASLIEEGSAFVIAESPVTMNSENGSVRRQNLREAILKEFGGRPKARRFQAYDFSREISQATGSTSNRQSPWEVLVVAATIGLVLLSIGFAVRANQFRTEAVNLARDTQNDFRKLFPGRRLNGPVQRMLAAELESAKQLNEVADFGNRNARCLEQLGRLLEGLPAEVKLKIESVDFLDDCLIVKGTVTSLEDLEKLKESLATAGLKFSPESVYSISFSLRLNFDPTEVSDV